MESIEPVPRWHFDLHMQISYLANKNVWHVALPRECFIFTQDRFQCAGASAIITAKDFLSIPLTHLGRRDGMGPVVDQQVIVAVQLQHIEAQHEPLQHRVRLEGDDAVQVAFVLGPQYGAVNLPVQLLQEVVLAQRLHVVWKINNTN